MIPKSFLLHPGRLNNPNKASINIFMNDNSIKEVCELKNHMKMRRGIDRKRTRSKWK